MEQSSGYYTYKRTYSRAPLDQTDYNLVVHKAPISKDLGGCNNVPNKSKT